MPDEPPADGQGYAHCQPQGGPHMAMKPLPTPHVPGSSEAERFDNAVRKVFSVSKDELLRRKAEWQRKQASKKRAKEV